MIWSMDTKNAMHEAVQIAGGVVALTRLLGLKNYQTVQQWVSSRPPVRVCPDIERVTNGRVTCERLRSDVDWGYLRGTRPECGNGC